MIKFLLILLIPVLSLGGWVVYSNYQSSNLENPQDVSREIEEPIEVPKTLPEETSAESGKSLEKVETTTINTPSPSPKVVTSSPLDSKVAALETVVNDLRVKVSNLEKSSSTQTTSTKSTVYIPLGSGGYWGNSDWYSLNEYEISLDPANYPGYSGMQLEVIFRLAESSGTGYVRLYNITDNFAQSGELSITSTTFGLQTTASFKLSSGAKTYRLQIKSSQGKDLYIQSGRIKVNF